MEKVWYKSQWNGTVYTYFIYFCNTTFQQVWISLSFSLVMINYPHTITSIIIYVIIITYIYVTIEMNNWNLQITLTR